MSRAAVKRFLASAYGLARRTPLVSREREGYFPILMYHSVNAEFPYSVRPDVFEMQMEFLAENYRVRAVNQVALSDAETAAPTAAVTFDDGYMDNHDVVLPILERHKLKATFFICAGYVSGAVDITKRFKNYRDLRPMDWKQVGRLRDAGMEIGAHSMTHPVLSELSRESKIEEITHSKRMLEKALGVDIDSFAYPFGYPWTFDKESEDIVRSEFRYCCTSEWGLNHAAALGEDGNLRLRRIRIDAGDSLDDFIGKVRGDWNYMRAVELARSALRKMTA
jgi:peptidoglycan/xylan/chitin deacetylase (PgdA/CDA1 family)